MRVAIQCQGCTWGGGQDGEDPPWLEEVDENCPLHGSKTEMEITPHIPIAEIVRRFCARTSDWHEIKAGVYHASESGFCYRKQVYKHTGVVGEDGPAGVFEMGRRMEDVIFESLEGHYGKGFVNRGVEIEIDLGEGVIAVGHTDVIVYTPEMEPFILTEIKSTKMVTDKTEPNESHKMQVSLYWLKIRPKHVVVIQGERADVTNMVETELSKEELERYSSMAVDYLKALHLAVVARKERGELPPALPMYPEWECETRAYKCPFLARCREDGGWECRLNAKGVETWIRTSV